MELSLPQLEDFRNTFDYNPETGELRWKVKAATNTRIGSLVDCRSNGYILVRFRWRLYKAHRVIWLLHYGEWPVDQLDHINRVRHDNRIANLRLATNTQNNINKPKQANNTSGFKGVSWNKDCNKWQSHIRINKRSFYLGLFETKEEASEKYLSIAKSHHGEFVHQQFQSPHRLRRN